MNELTQTHDWITGFRSGSLQAVSDLYTTHDSALLNFSEQIIRNRQEAREIVTETFIKLLNRRVWFDNLPDIKAFLYITTRNACMDYLRYTKNLQWANTPALDILESNIDIADKEIQDRAERILWSALENCPAVYQQIFRLLFIEGVPSAAAARQLEIDQRELLISRKKILQQFQMALADNNLYSIPFFIYFLTVACRTHQPVPIPVTVNH